MALVGDRRDIGELTQSKLNISFVPLLECWQEIEICLGRKTKKNKSAENNAAEAPINKQDYIVPQLGFLPSSTRRTVQCHRNWDHLTTITDEWMGCRQILRAHPRAHLEHILILHLRSLVPRADSGFTQLIDMLLARPGQAPTSTMPARPRRMRHLKT